MNNIFYLMKETVKIDAESETKNPTTNHSKFQSNDSNIKNYSEIKYQCNDIDFDPHFSFGNTINYNKNIIDNLSDNKTQTFEYQNNMTQRENIQVEIKKEEDISIKEEKTKKKETKISKKRKRCNSKEKS